jgi:hypothetical protein
MINGSGMDSSGSGLEHEISLSDEIKFEKFIER